MRTWPLASGLVLGAPILVSSAMVGACGGGGVSGYSNGAAPDAGAGNGASGSNDAGTQGPSPPVLEADAGSGSSSGGGTGPSGAPCLAGLTCDVACPGSSSTTITGKIYDPAGQNPLYNVAVYVPAVPLEPLPKGVPVGANACSCGALFPSGAVTNTTTAVDGSFTLSNVPVGSNVPLVFQIGKWRRQVNVTVKACQDNPQPDKSLAFRGTLPVGNTTDNIPDIAVSTGAVDTLECLLLRIGLPASEYVAGSAPGGHIHIFSGGEPANGTGSTMGTGTGGAESPPMAGAPPSWTSLWDTQTDLMPYDILLLSCEGGETYNSNPPALEGYLNAGGRAFASHYHYAWFAGSLEGDTSVPPPPVDWGSNLDAWNSATLPTPNGYAQVVQTLTGSAKPFPKGQVLAQWLQIVGALGVEGAVPGQIPIFDETQNAGATNEAQAWLTDNGTTDYLSFDTPANAPAPPDGGAPTYCGRAVFAGVHVDADQSAASANDKNPPPTGCAPGALSPQEKALEFMLFDLSSCVLPDTVPPPVDAGLPPPPK